MVLCQRINPKTGRCDPSIKLMSLETGANRKTVIAALATLEKDGWISKRRRSRSTAYTINFGAAVKSQKRDIRKPPCSPKTGTACSPKFGTQIKVETKDAGAAAAPQGAEPPRRTARRHDFKLEKSRPIAARASATLEVAPAHGIGREREEARQKAIGAARTARDLLLRLATDVRRARVVH